MRRLTVTQQVFTEMLSGIIASGVTFEAVVNGNNVVVITFTGGY